MLKMANNKNNGISHDREELLENRIEILQEHIRHLENQLASIKPKEKDRSTVCVLPVTYTPEQEQSPILEIISYSVPNDSNSQLLLVEQTTNPRVYETVV